MTRLPLQALVLYKRGAALVTKSGDKLGITLQDGSDRLVRPKDVVLLHPGPLADLGGLRTEAGDFEEAWELLEGGQTDLAELSELIFGEFTPASAWSCWQLVSEGLYFEGEPECIRAHKREDVERERAARTAKVREKADWAAFLERVREGNPQPEDRDHMKSVEALALGQSGTSRVMKDLQLPISPEGAHALLLRLGLWDETVNPYPARLNFSVTPPDLPVPALPREERLDLTHLPAFAIDDRGNQDPDDAISLDGDRLWIHVADVAALIHPDSDLDLEARSRGANLYHPEQTVPMLPPATTAILGLGLNPVSPALSFGVTPGEDGSIKDIQIVATLVKVTRLTYEEAETRLDEEPFRRIIRWTDAYGQRRKRTGAAMIDLPEVRVRVVEGRVSIEPIPALNSRAMVTEAMLMAGEAAAVFALEHQIPFPFTTQPPPDERGEPQTLSEMFAYRKKFKPSSIRNGPELHAGLGLERYTRATSPLRRYLDLVAHQQIRAFLKGGPVMSGEEMMARVGAGEALSRAIRRLERASNKHWTLVFLKQNDPWQGSGILVEKKGKRGTILIPELGLDAQMHVAESTALDSEISLRVTHIDLAELNVRFREEKPTP